MGEADQMRDAGELLDVTVTGDGTLRVAGEIDASSVRVLADHLEPLPEGRGEVLLDLAEVTFVDSSGLRVLIDAHQRAERGGRRLVLVEPSPVVRRLLDISGLDGLLHVRPDVAGSASA